ncbi:DUF2242 domain-containing protein [Pseudomonas gingeri NCPPB 3146 = LMG 5327]|uniref:DUF2242 domain-containing protein n=3 Tax=Pseudomonas gingeri TaxID=117681 RepID=A0A7Y7XU52_9PSED|nr:MULTISPECIES: DUF2242 domain-containing protein [Pseudomonas]NVZ28423.1 DUF2242 domain-containing protein [Pseudomonas gingeri]NWC12378.1 DUF2242 domain-containing protein [Pseudomonas gingeri]NWE72038.1 DUF2242 domain-containing protein [Pseudomonas gingeri]PNQ89138.1 DUF2242 domain-containing protein [Pseudomonas gingeri NCPPB 3146 = LMG 5327]BBP78146.1 lipoprotein [Pseudomonas sp. Ost2]
MSTSFHLRAVVLALVLAGAAGCSSPKTAVYEHENFDDSGTFSRNYAVSDTASCEAARRALLSQGYIITSSDPKLVAGNKSFQQTGDTHLQISFSVVCAADGSADHRSTMFANALQDRYALKKVNNSASLGVGVLGSVSMPIGSTDDSMVKVASETVSSAKFYDRFFTLVELFLPPEVKKEKHTDEKPKADLGVPETAPAAIKPEAAAEPAKAAEPSHVEPAHVAPALTAPAIPEPVKPLPEVAPATPAETAPATPAASDKPAEPTPAPTPAEPATPAQ